MADTTGITESEKGLTLEGVLALFLKTDKKFQETDKKFQESCAKSEREWQEIRERFQETDKKFQETDKKFQETERLMHESNAEIDRRFKETDRLIKELSRKWGNTSENIGFSAEVYFQTAISKTLRFAGILFDDIMPNVKRVRHGASCEFDILLINHNSVAIIEIKHRVPQNLPEIMVQKKASEFRAFFPEYKNYALYLGVAGMSVDKAVMEEAKKYGVGVLTQAGDALEFADIPMRVY